MFAQTYPETTQMQAATPELRAWAQSYARAFYYRLADIDEISPARTLWWLWSFYGNSVAVGSQQDTPALRLAMEARFLIRDVDGVME